MRPLVLALGLVSLAHAQTATPESRVHDAFENLRGKGDLYLRLAGTQTTGTRTTNFETQAIWRESYDNGVPALKFYLHQTRNGTIIQRIVGDGTYLWSYDPYQRTYSVTKYGDDDPAKMRRILVEAFSGAVGSDATHVTRLLREVKAGDVAFYRSWLPGPVAEDGEPDLNDVTYRLGNPVYRQVTIDLDERDDKVELVGIASFETRRIAGNIRETTWRLDVLDPASAPVTMNALPYTREQLAGWRPVLRPRPATSTTAG